MRKSITLDFFRVIVIVCTILLCNNVFAAGTPSGMNISNTAIANYDVATVPQSPITSNTASFLVDNKINLSVTTLDSIEVGAGAGQTGVATTFRVTNTGNSTQDYALAATITGIANPFAGGSDVFDPTSCSIQVEDGVNPGYQAGQDLATFIDELAPDASKTVYLVCNIPMTASANQVSAVALTASTRVGGTPGLGSALTETVGPDSPNVVDIVFADFQPVLAGVAGDALRDAAASAASAYKIGLSVILNKTVVCAPTPACITNFKSGDTVTYQINVNISGATVSNPANNLTLNDPIPANLSYAVGTIKVNNIAVTDAANFNAVPAPRGAINVILPNNITSSTSFLIEFKALIQ